MSNRLAPIVVVAAAALAAPLAMANQTGFRSSGDEVGSQLTGTPSMFSREEVKQDLATTPGGQAGFRSSGDLAGSDFRDAQSTLSREQVTADVVATPRAGFVSTREQKLQAQLAQEGTGWTGWRYAGSEGGWVFDGQ